MKVIFTCGGTAGHVNPALALAGLIKERHSEAEILFVGANRGMERKLVEKAGYPFKAIEMTGFRRSFSGSAIKHNLGSVKNCLLSARAANKILREFRPNLVVGTGGYASFPMVRAAAKAGIPTAVHESNAIPGLTTKMLERYADVIMVGFEDCRKNYRHSERVQVTGTPVRGDFFELTRAQAKARLGVNDGKPLVLSFWGSLGASGMNRQMADFIALESKKEAFHHVHGAGVSGYPLVRSLLQDKDIDPDTMPMVEVREYIYDMAVLMRAADLVVSRAGASTISELTALGVAAVIVPSPYVANNHQEKNALVLADHGAAVMLKETECSGEILLREVERILADEALRTKMEENMAALGIRDANERIYETIMALVKK